jgi:hypothetical protein
MSHCGIKNSAKHQTAINLTVNQQIQAFAPLPAAPQSLTITAESLSFASSGLGAPVSSQTGFGNLQDFGQLLGQLVNFAQYADPKAKLGMMAFDFMGQLANHALEQYNNSNGVYGSGSGSGYGLNSGSDYGTDYGLGSDLFGDSDENRINQEISDLLNRAQAMRSNGYKRPTAKCNKHDYQKREALALNNSIAKLSAGIANGSIPPHLAPQANELIGLMSHRASVLNANQQQKSTFSNGLGQIMASLYNGGRY